MDLSRGVRIELSWVTTLGVLAVHPLKKKIKFQISNITFYRKKFPFLFLTSTFNLIKLNFRLDEHCNMNFPVAFSTNIKLRKIKH